MRLPRMIRPGGSESHVTSLRRSGQDRERFAWNVESVLLCSSASALSLTLLWAGMLSKIKRSKYPAITAQEEAISIPLQTLAQAFASFLRILRLVVSRNQVLKALACQFAGDL